VSRCCCCGGELASQEERVGVCEPCYWTEGPGSAEHVRTYRRLLQAHVPSDREWLEAADVACEMAGRLATEAEVWAAWDWMRRVS
jgi:hypothetical protein